LGDGGRRRENGIALESTVATASLRLSRFRVPGKPSSLSATRGAADFGDEETRALFGSVSKGIGHSTLTTSANN
jgi:hypothetical protein